MQNWKQHPVPVAQATHMDQVLKEIRATQDLEAYLERQ